MQVNDCSSKEPARHLGSVSHRRHILPASEYLPLLAEVNHILETEDPRHKPRDERGLTGGLIWLNKHLPTIILPDFHAIHILLEGFLDSDWIGGWSGC